MRMARALLGGCCAGRAAPKVSGDSSNCKSNGCFSQELFFVIFFTPRQQPGTLLCSLPGAGLGSAFVGEKQRDPWKLMSDVLLGHVCILRVSVGSRKASDAAEFPVSLRD